MDKNFETPKGTVSIHVETGWPKSMDDVQIYNRIVDLQVGFENETESQKWCANIIQSITTQTPQL